jgi:excisionase family DNA binding protein
LELRTGFEPRLITTKEAADLVRVSPRTILNWIGRGVVPYVELPSGGDRKEYRIPLGAFVSSLSGTYDMAKEVRALDERASAAGATDEAALEALSRKNE